MLPVSIAMHWLSSVVYVSALSLWAHCLRPLVGRQAARVEVEQRRQDKQREREDMPGDIVKRMITDTDVEAAPGPPPSR